MMRRLQQGAGRWYHILLFCVLPASALAQDDGSRTYQLLPADTRFVTLFGVINQGNQADDPAIVTPDATIDTDLAVLRYAQYFALGGAAGSAFAILPTGKVSGTIGGKFGGTSSGIGDAQIGAMIGLVGYPALSTEDYRTYEPGFSAGALLKLSAPTGAYSSAQQINLGANRWSFRIGPIIAYSFGANFFDPYLTTFELQPSVTLFTANKAPFGAGRVQQAPLYHLEAHISRNLDKTWWVSADTVYFAGGATSTDGISNHNNQRSLALGASLGTQLGNVYLKATYGHVVERNEGGLYKKGIRLLAVYAF
jgi:hypothetical protein